MGAQELPQALATHGFHLIVDSNLFLFLLRKRLFLDPRGYWSGCSRSPAPALSLSVAMPQHEPPNHKVSARDTSCQRLSASAALRVKTHTEAMAAPAQGETAWAQCYCCRKKPPPELFPLKMKELPAEKGPGKRTRASPRHTPHSRLGSGVWDFTSNFCDEF